MVLSIEVYEINPEADGRRTVVEEFTVPVSPPDPGFLANPQAYPPCRCPRSPLCREREQAR